MSRVVAVALVAVFTLGAVAMTIFAGGERTTVVPPPEAVAEALLRQMYAHRYNRTHQFLSSGARAKWDPERLKQWWRDLESDIGRVEQIQGESHTVGESAGEGVVQVRGDRRTVVFRIPMRREHGLWTVSDMPPVAEAVRGWVRGLRPENT